VSSIPHLTRSVTSNETSKSLTLSPQGIRVTRPVGAASPSFYRALTAPQGEGLLPRTNSTALSSSSNPPSPALVIKHTTSDPPHLTLTVQEPSTNNNNSRSRGSDLPCTPNNNDSPVHSAQITENSMSQSHRLITDEIS